jgi:hypothetical protein
MAYLFIGLNIQIRLGTQEKYLKNKRFNLRDSLNSVASKVSGQKKTGTKYPLLPPFF